jgi:hypothetical protein
MSGGWLGDPRSEPCEMGGGKLVDYNQVREGQSTAHLYVTKAAVNCKLERIAALVESRPLTHNAAKALAVRIRGMKA